MTCVGCKGVVKAPLCSAQFYRFNFKDLIGTPFTTNKLSGEADQLIVRLECYDFFTSLIDDC